MKSNKTIKWGIIGLGKIAHQFATDLAKVTNAELYAVASRTQEKADNFSQKFNPEVGYDSYEKLVRDPQVDAIYIATPHSLHKGNTLLCLQNKKAVLCEKPFAMNLQEVEEMITIAKENDVLLMEALWTHFLPHYNYVLELLKSEKFGSIKKLEADFGFKLAFDLNNRLFNKEVGGGSLLDIGIYPIFAALSTLGNPDSINANATFFENKADSSCDIVFNYKDAKAVLKSTLLEETKTEAIFTLTNAIVKVNSRFHEPSTVTIITDGKEETLDFGYNTIGYSYEIEHFNQLLRDGKKESDIMTFDFSKNLIKTLDTVRKIIGLEY
ncbi:putative dehydrogenase [Lutibacter sp. Hel_I_33_5]|uniref:Gfo/Idh/MocA family protein n=1 Tax=Lutibacter sp. Hel_I_33_5 TaxID=1566289 RepID=UPI00119DE9D4|nr:Gfo/Idh/MocA family oxidoreductase [Lutibacter sp. Hel_I_33_5]TVZ55556.1 putative dehydrogenase [Lutibacter sp. Hel_I_33_5]